MRLMLIRTIDLPAISRYSKIDTKKPVLRRAENRSMDKKLEYLVKVVRKRLGGGR